MGKESTTKREEKRKRRQKCYQTKTWKELRLSILQEEPLCRDCKEKGIITLAEECHHTNHPFRETNDEKMWEKFTDRNHIVPLCKQCHIKRHEPKGMTIQDKLNIYSD